MSGNSQSETVPAKRIRSRSRRRRFFPSDNNKETRAMLAVSLNILKLYWIKEKYLQIDNGKYTIIHPAPITLCFPARTQNLGGAWPPTVQTANFFTNSVLVGAELQRAVTHTLSWVLHDLSFEYLLTETQSVYFPLELSVCKHWGQVATLASTLWI